ncbi:MAG: 3-methyl-2-oxobutanoate dehydrogenase subunit VorB [Oscillospiraceae bacterium]|jgi:2-oxoglutarate ferredoxin oxidoreductase subunit alpha|nr:3-methyl-2-oxobutanoate dehydrogenase subunit VorB [Oscillospiraceae bacterium]
MTEKVLMKGNEAFAEAAIRGGSRYYFGYPITPQSEIPEFMSRELPKWGGAFVQAESELAAINMAYGAAASGGNVFISSSSPGIALMQEGLSFMCSAQVPIVILNVSRCGPGVGGIQPGQSDYNQVTRGGGNGDYRIPVFAPDCIQSAVDLIYEATDLSQKYRNPIMILADGMMGQMMEPVLLPEPKYVPTLEELPKARPWAVTGTKKGYRNVINSLYLKPEQLEVSVENIYEKYREAEKELVKYETSGLEDAEVVFVAFGTVARITREAIEILAAKGVKAGLIRPISLWPFPAEAFDHLSPKTKVVISTELSMGQMIDDVERSVSGRCPVRLIHRVGGIVPTSLEVVDHAMKILGEYK